MLNKILYNWYEKSTSSNIYPDGALLQEKAMQIKKRLDKEELNDFTASNGWLESWMKTCEVRENRLCGEADDVSTTTIEAWQYVKGVHIRSYSGPYSVRLLENTDQNNSEYSTFHTVWIELLPELCQ